MGAVIIYKMSIVWRDTMLFTCWQRNKVGLDVDVSVILKNQFYLVSMGETAVMIVNYLWDTGTQIHLSSVKLGK